MCGDGGKRVVSKRKRTVETQNSVNGNQKDQQEVSPELENQAQAQESEVEQEEPFDPETANREALLDKYRDALFLATLR